GAGCSGTSERSVRTIIRAPSTSLAVASGRSPRSRARNRHSGQSVHEAPGIDPHSGQRPSSPRVGDGPGPAPVSLLAVGSPGDAVSPGDVGALWDVGWPAAAGGG